MGDTSKKTTKYTISHEPLRKPKNERLLISNVGFMDFMGVCVYANLKGETVPQVAKYFVEIALASIREELDQDIAFLASLYGENVEAHKVRLFLERLDYENYLGRATPEQAEKIIERIETAPRKKTKKQTDTEEDIEDRIIQNTFEVIQESIEINNKTDWRMKAFNIQAFKKPANNKLVVPALGFLDYFYVCIYANISGTTVPQIMKKLLIHGIILTQDERFNLVEYQAEIFGESPKMHYARLFWQKIDYDHFFAQATREQFHEVLTRLNNPRPYRRESGARVDLYKSEIPFR